MDDIRRGKLRVLLRMLDAIGEEVRSVWQEEEGKFDDRSDAAKYSSSGHESREAVKLIENAHGAIDHAADLLRSAVGD